MATPPIFITRDVSAVLNELLADYQSRTGRTLQPSQVETFILHTMAYRENLIANQIQNAAEQNLVAFSNAPVLDFLGELVGVSRLGATPASCTVRFVLVAGHLGVIVPAGTRVASVDGRAVFATTQSAAAATGVAYLDIPCESQALGTSGNGYAVGGINTLLDPLAFVTAVTNLDTTAGGAEQEDDENLRERIRLAPASFSNAGSVGAYRYWARSASADIVDVAVVGDTPGVVKLYPLMRDGSTTPTQIINAVLAACRSDDRRPLCDTVVAYPPTRINYALAVDLTLYDTADPAVVQAQVEAALQAFVDERRTKLGKDLVSTQIIGVCQIEGVYRVDLPGFVDITVAPTEFPYCISIAVQVVGTTEG